MRCSNPSVLFGPPTEDGRERCAYNLKRGRERDGAVRMEGGCPFITKFATPWIALSSP